MARQTQRHFSAKASTPVIFDFDDEDAKGNGIIQKKDRYADSPIRFRLHDDHYELHVLGYIEEESCPDDAINALMTDMENADKSMELHILINSYGGSVSMFSSILQQTMEFNYRVTVVKGVAASAGFLLWAAGDERYVSPYSELMYHDIAGDATGKSSEIRDIGEHMDMLAEMLQSEILDGRDIISDEDIKRGKRTEVWYCGADFIRSGAARDYRDFKNRPVTDLACNLAVNGKYYMCYGDANSNQYVEVTPDTSHLLTYQEIMQRAFGKQNDSNEKQE